MKRILSYVTIFALIFAVAGNTVMAEETGNTEGTAEIAAGSLTLTAPVAINFGVLQIGVQDTSIAPLEEFVVYDYRGSGAGWDLNVMASELSNVDNTLVGARLSIGSGENYKLIDGEEINYLSIEGEAGMGENVLVDNLKLVIDPDTTKSGSYTTTITWNLVNGPQ